MSVDQYWGAKALTTHLIDLGHRDIRHIAGPANSWDALERVRGWKDAMAAHRVATRESIIGDWTPQAGYAAARSLHDDVPTAIFAANDQMAIGAMHALRDLKIAVPDDLSVVGFDDIPEAEHSNPGLTTVRQDFRGLGRDAFAAVVASLDDDQDQRRALSHLPELVIRESSAFVRDSERFIHPDSMRT